MPVLGTECSSPFPDSYLKLVRAQLTHRSGESKVSRQRSTPELDLTVVLTLDLQPLEGQGRSMCSPSTTRASVALLPQSEVTKPARLFTEVWVTTGNTFWYSPWLPHLCRDGSVVKSDDCPSMTQPVGVQSRPGRG